MQSVFQTTDSDLAVYLCAEGNVLLGTVATEGRTVFLFPTEAALSADAYYNGASVSAKRFLYSLKKLGVLRRALNSGDSENNQSNGKTYCAPAM